MSADEIKQITETEDPYADITTSCLWCAAWNGEAHYPDCDWVRIRAKEGLLV